MKKIKCQHCGKLFMGGLDDPPLAIGSISSGEVFGPAVGSVLPDIGTDLGNQCAVSAENGCFECPRCHRANDIMRLG